MIFYIYILHSSLHDKIYIGFTSNLENRILSHNSLATKGYTVRFRPWTLIYTEKFDTKKEAMIRERQLKSAAGRSWIRNTLLKP